MELVLNSMNSESEHYSFKYILLTLKVLFTYSLAVVLSLESEFKKPIEVFIEIWGEGRGWLGFGRCF